jgi:hypothetical protein
MMRVQKDRKTPQKKPKQARKLPEKDLEKIVGGGFSVGVCRTGGCT